MNKNNEVKAVGPVLNTNVSFFYRGSETSGNNAMSAIIGTLLSWIISMSVAMGALLTFTTMFSVSYHSTLFFVLAMLYGLAMAIVFQLPKKIVRFSMLGVLALIGIIFLVFYDEAIAGFGYIKDFMLVGIAKAMYWTEPELSYTFTEAMKADTTAAIFPVAILVITGVSYFSVRKINFLLIFLITFPLFEVGAAFGCVPNHFCFAAMLAGWMGVFAMHISNFIRKIKKRRADKKKTKTTSATRKQSFIASIGVVVAVITFMAFALGNILVSINGYDRPENMQQLRSDFKEGFTEFIDYILGIDNDGSLREGRLYQMGDRVIKNRHYLTVKAPLRTQTYLRGYVGGTYTGDSWNPTETSAEYGWLEASYKATGYYPQSMQGQLLKAMEDGNQMVKNSAATVTISDLRRKKDYAYTTYVPLLSNDFTLNGDYSISPNSKSSYSYNAYMDDNNFFMMKMSPLYKDKEFASVWDEYTRYAKETYTKYPGAMGDVEAIVDGLKNGTGYGYKGKGMAQSNLELADRIREYLNANIKYSLTVDKLPAETEFVNWLLSSEKQGYSAHYATAMAVMLRMGGIPTRYVEGYVITPEDFKLSTAYSEGYYTMELTDLNAHAWIEMYDSNYGWMPIEATPGFYEGSLLDSMDSASMDQITTPEEEEYTNNEQSDEIVFEEMDEDDELPEVEKEEEETPISAAFQTILNVIKYLFIFVGVAAGAFIAFMLAAFLVLALRRTIKLSRLKKGVTKGDVNGRVCATYRYYLRLLAFEDIENSDNLLYLDFAKEVGQKSERLTPELHLQVTEALLKHRFSAEPATEADVQRLVEIVTMHRNEILKGLKPADRFDFKFIENLA